MRQLNLTKHTLHETLSRLDEDEGRSFLAVVAMSGVVLVFVFFGALLVLGLAGSGILPNIHKPDLESTSMLVMPAHVQSTASGMRA
jgi:hypothetical protein